MTKPLQPELNWDEIPLAQSGPDDSDIDVGQQVEDEIAAMQIGFVGRINPPRPDMSVFSLEPVPETQRHRSARSVLKTARISDLNYAAEMLDNVTRPKSSRGKDANRDYLDMLRLELVLSAYALHGPGTHESVSRFAEEVGVEREWLKKWRARLRKLGGGGLMKLSQESRAVVVYSDSGTRSSSPLDKHLWPTRLTLLEDKDPRKIWDNRR